VITLTVFSLFLLALVAQRGQGPRGPAPDPDQLVGRFGPSDDSPQLAGSKCAACEQKILTDIEAAACKVCNQPVHRDCRRDHRRDAHRRRSPAVYR
jgi:hypothetical protein